MIVEKKYCDICGKEILHSAKLIKHTRKVFYTKDSEEDCCVQCLYKISGFIEKLKNQDAETQTKAITKIWHDLIVNPDDLPEKCGPYIVFTNGGYTESNFYKIQIDKNEWEGCFDISGKVYAWCETHFERDARWEKKEGK